MNKGLRYFPDTPVNQSIGIVGKLMYWHPYALRHVMREVASRYPITYHKVGESLAAKDFDLHVEGSEAETYQMMVAILALMPPHVIPFGPMGDNTPWGEIDWTSLLSDLQSKQ